ncbi:M23 family metallopeptidase [Flavihumibacter petaseus]|uniref:Peptidase M23 family protein n=1 Tax=Flavihumibacter petaseus NBRC 106054 TaxID=1220578 RepID=A0A0E9MWC8_9BACT|nr:M23 family metallopeptidase [Flavihumibacter petaseus]GAO41823.1 peptidase M23 family protein [Flavihumibacter petaseus NBRC 106054]
MFRLIFLFLFFPVAAFSQFSPTDYPKGYFRSPLEVPIDLSGNFGELRPNHYHMGLDLKTLRRENLPVYAAAEGYISRIKIEPFGFGRAIYITHPNGYTTVYCHLNNFAPALEAWVTSQQYEHESWELYIQVPPEKFPLKKGDLIAYSGNTGGSQAPHVHFEIRRTTDDVNLNPMLFGFPLQDHTRPSILRLAVYDRRVSTYEQSPRLIGLAAKGAGEWTAAPITVSSPLVSFAITAYDTHDGSTNANGIFEASLWKDNKPVIGFRMDNIGYDATRYLNAHIDYRTKAAGGPYLQHLSELPGYIRSIYTQFSGDGVIDLSDGLSHPIRIDVKDAYGNTSTLQTSVRYDGKGIPAVPAAGQRFYPLMVGVYESPEAEFVVGEKALYDSVSLTCKSQPSALPQVVSAVHQFGSTTIPLQDSILVRIRPSAAIAPGLQGKVVMQRFAGTKKDVSPVTWNKDWAMARFRDFGSFQLVVDTTPPEIHPVGWADNGNLSKAQRLLFSVSDNLGAYKMTRTLLDGAWIRFTNDKARNFEYRFDERCRPGKHQLTIIAFDAAGNRTEKTFSFTR